MEQYSIQYTILKHSKALEANSLKLIEIKNRNGPIAKTFIGAVWTICKHERYDLLDNFKFHWLYK